MSSVGRLLSLFRANYKVKYNLCDDYIQCLDGALISSEVNKTAHVRIPAKTLIWVPLLLFIDHEKNIRANTVVFLWSS